MTEGDDDNDDEGDDYGDDGDGYTGIFLHATTKTQNLYVEVLDLRYQKHNIR